MLLRLHKCQSLALMLAHIARHMEATVPAVSSVLVLALLVVPGFLLLGVAISLHEGSTLLFALKSLKLLQRRQTSLDLACIWVMALWHGFLRCIASQHECTNKGKESLNQVHLNAYSDMYMVPYIRLDAFVQAGCIVLGLQANNMRSCSVTL